MRALHNYLQYLILLHTLFLSCANQATILLVGYFVLGPSDLYKVVKEVGKFIQNFRTLGTDLTKTVESNLESNLELEEIRKAQRELNDAFSFRRTINTDGKTDAFATTPEDRPGGELSAEPVVASTVAAGTKKRKKVRRRKVKKEVFEEGEETPVFEAATIVAEDISIQGNVPDLDMSAAFYNKPASASTADLTGTAIESGEERLSKDREERLESETPPVETSEWWNAGLEEDATEPVAAEAGLMSVESDRFTAQLSGDWNESVLTNEGKLSPLAKIIDRLTILEEEKSAADERLEEEFRLRGELEEKYYREKRDLLETAAAEIQVDAYGGMVEDRNS